MPAGCIRNAGLYVSLREPYDARRAGSCGVRAFFDLFGAENGTRTRDLNLGKVALYQLSYFRMACFAIASAKVNKKSETPNFFCGFCGFFIAKPA